MNYDFSQKYSPQTKQVFLAAYLHKEWLVNYNWFLFNRCKEIQRRHRIWPFRGWYTKTDCLNVDLQTRVPGSARRKEHITVSSAFGSLLYDLASEGCDWLSLDPLGRSTVVDWCTYCGRWWRRLTDRVDNELIDEIVQTLLLSDHQNHIQCHA